MGQQQGGQSGEAPMLELRVTVDQKGRVYVRGPIHLQLLCLGALEQAKQAIQGWNAQQARREAEEAERGRIEIGSQEWLKGMGGRNGSN